MADGEINFDCPEFPTLISIQDAIAAEEGCDGWAARAIAELFIRDTRIEMAHRRMLASDPQALRGMLNRWFNGMTADLDRLNESMRQATAAFRVLADMLRDGDERDVRRHPDLAELNAMLDGFYRAEETQQ